MEGRLTMLERMDAFFDARLNGYEEHMLRDIESARTFYPFTADLLPKREGAHILDLGCGTGLELNYYFALNPTARVTGIDLAGKMLDVLRQKFPECDLTLIQGSYFDLPLERDCYDCAVSIESLHHFTKAEKIPLYAKLRSALKAEGYFILTDYFAENDEDERFFRSKLTRLKAEQGIEDSEFYHYDTPLTLEHETEALRDAGFGSVELIGKWGATCTVRAKKPARNS